MSETTETTPEELPKSNDPSLEELAERVKLGGPGDMPPPPGYDPNSGLPPAPPGADAPVSKPERRLSTNILGPVGPGRKLTRAETQRRRG